jgi:hypothetical protein
MSLIFFKDYLYVSQPYQKIQSSFIDEVKLSSEDNDLSVVKIKGQLLYEKVNFFISIILIFFDLKVFDQLGLLNIEVFHINFIYLNGFCPLCTLTAAVL